jgi:hypothetical protein
MFVKEEKPFAPGVLERRTTPPSSPESSTDISTDNTSIPAYG